jgi:hypothetical protein
VLLPLAAPVSSLLKSRIRSLSQGGGPCAGRDGGSGPVRDRRVPLLLATTPAT